MKVKMTTLECGPAGTFHPGDEREVSDEVGRQLVAGNHAVDVSPRQRETAAFVPSETAVMPAASKHKKAK